MGDAKCGRGCEATESPPRPPQVRCWQWRKQCNQFRKSLARFLFGLTPTYPTATFPSLYMFATHTLMSMAALCIKTQTAKSPNAQRPGNGKVNVVYFYVKCYQAVKTLVTTTKCDGTP